MNIAKSMFNELGFKLYDSREEFLLYKNETDYERIFVHFDLKLEIYYVYWEIFIDHCDEKFVSMGKRPQNIKHSAKYGYWQRNIEYNIDVRLHKAIHQQLIELGWIKN